MTAHDDAAQAISEVIGCGFCDTCMKRASNILDAIPDGLLVDLLVERGVLEPVTLPHGNHTISVYQRKDTR